MNQVAPVAPVQSEVAWDDEEDFEPAPIVSHGDAPKLSKEKADKLAKVGPPFLNSIC